MELRTLNYFITVAEMLHFSAAAEKLGLSQSAMSRQIQLLEEQLGVRLFDRMGRKVFLTTAGRDLLERSYEVRKAISSLTARATELASGNHGIIRVGATPQTLESLISKMLPQFQRRCPEARISLVEGGGANLEQALDRGDLDLAIGALDQNHGFESRPLFSLEVLAALPKNHRLSHCKSIEIGELANEQLLLLRKEFMSRKVFDDACLAAHVVPRVLIESASPHCLLALVQSGLGLAIIPSTVPVAKGRPHVVPITQNSRLLRISVGILWDPRRYTPPVVRSFIEELSKYTKNNYQRKSVH